MMRNSVEPNNQLEMKVTSISATILAIVPMINTRINPNDNVTAIPMTGSRINITTAATSAAKIMAPSINKNRRYGLLTSLPFMIIRVLIGILSLRLLKTAPIKDSKIRRKHSVYR